MSTNTKLAHVSDMNFEGVRTLVNAFMAKADELNCNEDFEISTLAVLLGLMGSAKTEDEWRNLKVDFLHVADVNRDRCKETLAQKAN
jgi:hypothetical protein